MGREVGPFRLIRAKGPEVDRALDLRALCFRAGKASDRDGLDARCDHFLVLDEGGAALATFRTLLMTDGRTLSQSYAAQSYDLSRLASYPKPILELGRFCIHPKAGTNPDILRLAWAGLTALVQGQGVGLLIGCTSFEGADAARHAPALARLRDHIAPEAMAPLRKSPQAIPLPLGVPRANAPLPPLLRSYLAMGGWVSDHAVPDPDLDTLHVFTGVETARVPPTRAAALRLWAESQPGLRDLTTEALSPP